MKPYVIAIADNIPGKVHMVHKQLTVHRTTVLSTNQEPCNDEWKEPLNICLDQYYTKQLNCRLPWNVADTAIRPCNMTKDLIQLENISIELEFQNQRMLYKTLNCTMPCTTMEYILQDYMQYDMNCTFNNCNGQLVNVTLSILDGNLYTSKEVWLYGWSNFFADFGGYLGLLLGISVFTVYEGMKKLAKRIPWNRLT